MNTKPFNLELANLGHPLVTRDGKKVVQFIHLKKPFEQTTGFVLRALLENGCVNSYHLDGKYSKSSLNYRDLFLDLDTPWVKPLQEGDIVEVLNPDNSEWEDGIFLSELNDGSALLVYESNKDNYENNLPYNIIKRDKDKWRRKQDVNININITINGKPAKLSDISEETLLKIRNNY